MTLKLLDGCQRTVSVVVISILTACASTAPIDAPTPTNAAIEVPEPKRSDTKDASAPAPEPAQRQPSVVMGTGQFIGTPESRVASVQSDGQGIQLTFVDTDIRAVLSSILGDALGVSYTIDPAIKGTITVQSARPLQKAQLLRALEAALSLQDIALVEHDGAYDVVPMKDAARKISGLRLPQSAGAPGFGVQIVPLRYTSAEEMNKILTPFAPQGAIVRVDDTRNLLVLAGTGQELSSLLEVVQTFDVDWLSGMSYAFYPVSYVDAKTITDELKEVFNEQKSPMSGIVRLIPLARLNTVLVASPQPDYLQKVGEWIKRLDLGGSSPGRQIYVYDVQNGRARDLASSLNRIFGFGDADAYSPQGSGSNTDSTSTKGMGGLSQTTPSFGTGGQMNQLQSFRKASDSREYASGYSGPPQQASATVSLEGAGLRIVPDEGTNALLVLATPSEFGVIDAAIKRLDVSPRQVLIEASLAEVTLTNELKFGVEWFFKSGRNTATFSPNNTGGLSSQFPGFSYLFAGADISVVLNALESITKVKVLSAPKLLVLNNHEAEIEVGDQVPILSQQAVSVGQTNAPIVNSVAQRDTGVILHITPRVNQSGMVILDIAQEVSSVIPTTTSNIDSPTIQERKVSSTVAVRDGETIALGGLITDSKSVSKGGIPFLQRIPLIGALFGTTDNSVTRTELIILIKPRVIRDPNELSRVMSDLHEQFRSVELQTGQGKYGKQDGKPR